MLFRVILVVSLMFVGLNARFFQTVPSESATLIQEGESKNFCPNCGMNLIKFHKTSHAHEKNQYCSMHCLYESTKGMIPDDAKVIDAKNLGFIDAKSAFYVVGSKVRGTMSRTSKYAFKTHDEAYEFLSQNGGKIMSFEEAYKVAKEDFPAGHFGEKVEVVKSEKIVVPKDAKCPICGMFVVKYPQWVTEVVMDGKSYYFDGVKDMMKFIFMQEKPLKEIYVSDYYKLTKINAKDAYYVIGSDVYGPMGMELIPFASEEEALTFLKDHNGTRVLVYDQITKNIIDKL